MKRILISLLLCFSAAASTYAAAPETAKKPKNILLIYVDDLRPEMSCYGNNKIIAPNIDKLAKRAMVFNKAYCQVPICMPSRVSTLSGMYTRSVGHAKLRQLLPKENPSLPGYMMAHGYDTVSIGKVYHFNNDDPTSWTKRYTDTFSEEKLVCDGYCSGYQLPVNQNGLTFSQKWKNSSSITESVDAPDSAYPDGRTAEHAVAELKKYAASGKPMFLAAGFYRPHLPWAAPKKYWDLYKREDIQLAKNQFSPKNGISRNTWGDVPQYNNPAIVAAIPALNRYDTGKLPVLPEDMQREMIHGYQACISFVDAQIGKVLDELEKSGLKDNTMVIFISDHGWSLGEHNSWSKCSNFEEALRVPFIIAAPGIDSGKTEALTELVDVYPTICQFTDLPVPNHVEGTGLMPVLKSPTRPWKKAAFNIWTGSRSMRTDRYRLTRYDKAAPKGNLYQLPGKIVYELYDYQTDPAGNINIAQDPAKLDLVKELIQQMNAGWKAAKPVIEGK